jgi:hypothetical protein
MENEWVDVVGYEGIYQITRCGKMRSLDRLVKGRGGNRQRVKGTLLKPSISDGYLYFHLRDGEGGRHNKYMHRLLCVAFLPNHKNYPCVNHKDSNRANNSLDNLEWCTQQQNIQHAYDNGRIENLNAARGEQSGVSILKDWQVREIKHKLRGKETVASIARDYLVDFKTISSIRDNKTWKHIAIAPYAEI